MELAPAGPGSGRDAVDLFTFLSREAEKSLRWSAGLFVPQSAYGGSSLAIPCPRTGPLHRRSPPAPLAAHSGPAVKPSASSRRKKRWRGAPSCGSAGEEVVSQPAYMSAAASKPASSPAIALSARLAAPPPMPSALAPARCSEATPDELEQRLRFYARQIKSFRKTSLMYSSPELMDRIRQMERDYETAVRQFYCRPPPSTPGLQGAAAAAEQPMPGPHPDSRPDTPQPGMTPDPKSASTPSTRRRGRRKRDAPAQVIGGPGDAPAQATEGLGDISAPAHATEGPVDASAPVPSLQGFSEELVLVL
ncbi:hypothetical protein ILYODFUR_037641, partial [Ilyodon furcidens]